MKSLNRSGQEEAPFELLVAVILMGFVLFVGQQAIGVLAKQQCEQNISGAMNQLRQQIETVAKTQSTRTASFSPDCLNEGKQKIQLRAQTDPFICGSVCSGSRNTCVILQFLGQDLRVDSLCVNIPITTRFDSCSPRGGYGNLDFYSIESIPKGNYLIESAFDLTSEIPRVCAYRKERA